MIWSTNLCRICAQIRNICIPIFQKNVDIGIDIKIKRCTSLSVSQDDLKPHQVCQECLIKLNDFYSFVLLYDESNGRFETLLNTSNTGIAIQEVMELDYSIITTNQSIKSDDDIAHLNIIDHCKDITKLNDLYANVESHEVEQNLLNEIVANVVDENVEIELQNLVSNVENKQLQDDSVMTYLNMTSSQVCTTTDIDTERKVENVGNNELKKKTAKARIISVQTLCQSYEKLQPKYEKASVYVTKTRLPKNSYLCIKCGKVFRSRHCLNEHFKKHSDARPYTCDCCGKGFTLQSDLTCHKHLHTDLFGCKFCGKRFTAPSKLQRHVRTHTGEKPFKCDVKDCGRSFSDKCNLMGHQLTHSNVRNFTCDICKRSYKTKNQLKNHVQAHSDNPIYKCNVCNKLYRWRTNLVNHIKKHGKLEIGSKTEEN